VIKIPAIILAAGESKRMGRPKALLPFRGGTFLSVLAETLEPFCGPVIAVFGYRANELALSAPKGVLPVANHAYKAGMLTSLQAGLRELDLDKASRVLFTLVDHPAILPETVTALLRSKAPIAIPRREGRRGHPVIIDNAIAREFLAEPANAKVRFLIDRHASDIEYVEVADPGISDDIDDPALYQSLLEREAVAALEAGRA
jgi:molybdenum cofactor cytidylyltransferase